MRSNPTPRRSRALLAGGAGALALSMALAGCASAGDATVAADDDGPIVIGMSAPIAAAIGAFGQPAVDGAQLAVDEINAAGGIDGRDLELVVEDNACNATDGQTAVESLIEQDVVAIIGGLCSDATLPALTVVQRSEIPLLVDLASNPSITAEAGVGGNEWVFRWAPSDDITAQTAVEYLDSLGGYDEIAVIADDGAFGQGGAEAIEAKADELGITVLSTDLVNLETPDFSSVVARVSQSEPDAVVVWLNASATIGSFYEAYAASDLKSVPLAGQLDMTQSAIADNELFGYNSASYSASIESEGNSAYLAAWEGAGFDVANAYVGWDGYQSVQILASVLEDAPGIDPASIKDTLTGYTYGPMIVGGEEITFDDHNQAYPNLVIEQFTGSDVEPVTFEGN
ncbi:ABC transporter substrate-binding protein [Agromyces sp. SYSU T00194]|uniref:ABC transporter substrate-binding protein n=1 Tax=Agromyces chitinivorans TaxID=3158560 RepID=UPI003397EB38